MIQNSGLIAFVLCVVTLLYVVTLFRTDCKKSIVDISYMNALNPSDAIVDRKLIRYGLPLLFLTIAAFVAKDTILTHF